MSINYASGSPSSSLRIEQLAVVAKRLQAEFPDLAADQVVRSVQIARESVKSAGSTADAGDFGQLVEAQARHYLAKFQAVRTRSAIPLAPTVVDLSAVDEYSLQSRGHAAAL